MTIHQIDYSLILSKINKINVIIPKNNAIANVILDYLFVMKFGWGMTGAAVATVIGQVLSFAIVVRYLFNFKEKQGNINPVSG